VKARSDEKGGLGSAKPAPDGKTDPSIRIASEAPSATERSGSEGASAPSSPRSGGGEPVLSEFDTTINLTGDAEALRGLDDRDTDESLGEISRAHLKGLLEALIFASDRPVRTGELAKTATAGHKQVKELLGELKGDYQQRGVQLDEVAGGWVFRTNIAYAPFVRDLTKQRPVRLTRAQVETLAILAYRQPITRPEIDEVRGVDSGPVLKLLLERDLIRILGKKDEPGRPILYGTTSAFLEFFGLKSIGDLPTLREFTELNEDSRRMVEHELGDVLEGSQPSPAVSASEPPPRDTLPPGNTDPAPADRAESAPDTDEP
jgi:segregation and condensation protein B